MSNTIIHQADQYVLPIKVKYNYETVTPDTVDDIRISVGGFVQSHGNNELQFDGENWLFNLKQEHTARLPSKTKCQVEIKFSNTRIHSSVFEIDVKESLLRGVWQ